MSADLDARAFVKRKGALVPADVMADDFLARIPDGREVLVTVRRARNVRHHRLLWAMLNTAVANSDLWPSPAALLDELKLATGLAEVRVNLLTGKPYAVPGSISFAAMDQERFRAWFEQAVVILARALGTKAPELADEILAMCEPAGGAA